MIDRIKHTLFKFSLFLIGMMIFSNVFAAGQDKIKMSLKEAILLSLRYNPNIKSGELQRVADKFALAVAKNQFEFQYSLNGSGSKSQSMSDGTMPWLTTRNFNVTPEITRQTRFGTQYTLTMQNNVTFNSSNPGHFYNPSLTLSVVHPLLRGSGQLITEAPLNQAFLSEENNKLAYKNVAMQNITQVILDYRSVVLSENALIVDTNALQSARETVRQNKIRIKNGFMAPAENVQAEQAVAAQELQLVTDKNAIIQAKLQLLQDIGLPSTTEFEVDNEITTTGISYPKGEEALRILFCNNISYLTTINNLKSQKLSVLQAEDLQRWSLDLSAEIAQGPGSGGGPNAGLGSLFNGNNVSRSIGLTFNVPIDDMQSQQALVTSKVTYNQNQIQAKQLKQVLESQLKGTLENLFIGEKQIELSKLAADLANTSYQDSLKKLAYGKVSVFEVTTLQSSLISSQITYINNQIQYLNDISTYQLNLGITLDVWGIHLVY